MSWWNPDWWNPQRVTAAATVIYAGASILLWLVILSQTKATKRAADAAKRSADALIESERPHMLAEEPPTLVVTQQDQRRHATAYLRMHNYGKSPAWVAGYRIRLEFMDGVTLPPVPAEDHVLKLEAAYVVPPGRFVDLQRHAGVDGWFDQAEWDAIDGHLFFFGFIDYTDTFQKTHRSGFAWQYVPQRDVFTPYQERAYWPYT